MSEPSDHSKTTKILRRNLRRRQRIALLGLLGIPALAAAAEGGAKGDPVDLQADGREFVQDAGYYCTQDTDTVAMLESGSSAPHIFFNNVGAAPRQPAGKRACFPMGVPEYMEGEDHYPLPRPSMTSYTVSHRLMRSRPLADEGGQGTLAFTVMRGGAVGQPSTLAFSVGGTTESGTDYEASGGTAGVIDFPPGSLSQTITVDLLDDSVPEPDETIQVTLSSPATRTGFDAEIVGTNPAAITVLDDDTTANLIPERHFCRSGVFPWVMEQGPNAPGVYWSQDDTLAEGSGIYCISDWYPPSIGYYHVYVPANWIPLALDHIEAGDAMATIHFTGGVAGASYVAFCGLAEGGGGSVKAFGSVSPIRITGLDNGMAYLCTVATEDNFNASFPRQFLYVTPHAPPSAPPVSPPHPIFLLAPWSLALLSGLLGLLGIGARRRWR